MRIDPLGNIPESLQGGVVAIGNFEGVHRGHCRLLAKLRERARQAGGPAVAVSFDPHPLSLLRPGSPPAPLLWADRKEEILAASGADRVAIFRTTPEFLQLTAEEFFQRIVVGGFRARGMVEGRNFGYGRGRAGNIDVLARQCASAGLFLDVVDVVVGQGESEVSSTRIRRELSHGRLREATDLLGRPHRVRGRVVKGDGRGAAIGFATANLADVDVLTPAEGVYAGQSVWEGKVHPAACNIGPNPTFGVADRKLEVHLVGFSGDLYGRELQVDLLQRIRGVRSFQGVDDLRRRIAEDVEEAAGISASYRHPYGCDLGQTIAQWIQGELEAAFDSPGGAIQRVVLDPCGRLTVDVESPAHPTPPVAADLLGNFEDRLREVFPEATSLAWNSPASRRLT